MKLADIDFLVIGATKSATTWLQRSLQADPDVFMPDPELHYFSRELQLGDDWYLDQFAGAAPGQRIGEKSNSYLEDPQAAARIARSLPRARLVAQLRSPIERAYSDYCMMYRRGEVGRDVARYLAGHRITTVAERVRPVDGTTVDSILRLAQDESADLIVAGAYGHSRLGEWVFGGVTQALLSQSPVCCLFSH